MVASSIYEPPPASSAPPLPLWQPALAKARAGVDDARILCVGDSTTFGTGTVAYLSSYPVRLASFVASLAASTSVGSVFGKPAVVLDPRVTVGAGWAASGVSVFGTGGFGGIVGGGTLSFTPAETFDTITVVHFQGPAIGGSSSVNVDGGAALGNISGVAGTNQVTTTTFSCAAGTHTINIASPVGAPLLIVSVEVSLTTSRRVLLENAGHAFTTSGDWAGNAFTSAIFAQLAPDLTIINLGKNDAGGGVSASSTLANLEALIGMAQLTGDVILCAPTPSQNAPWSTNEARLRPLLEQLAAGSGARYVDLFARWESWTDANTRGMMADALHPNATGYFDVAAAVWETLAPAS